MKKWTKIYNKLNQLNMNDVCRAFGNGVQFHGIPIIRLIVKHLLNARKKHPTFAHSKDEALRLIGAEYGELLQACTKGEGGRREREEAAHVIVTLIRFLGKEWREAETEDRVYALLEGAEETSAQRAPLSEDEIISALQAAFYGGESGTEIVWEGDDETGTEA